MIARRLFLSVLALGALACSSAPTATVRQESCPVAPAGELMALSYDAFDTSDGQTAWRTLLNRGCVDAAVATLDAYQRANRGRMTDEQTHELSFHIGQTFAFAGREPESIRHFEAAAGPNSTAEWGAYVEATIGFVRNDRARVMSAEARYQKLAEPGSMRLGIIRGFLKCFDRPYKEAAHCSM